MLLLERIELWMILMIHSFICTSNSNSSLLLLVFITFFVHFIGTSTIHLTDSLYSVLYSFLGVYVNSSFKSNNASAFSFLNPTNMLLPGFTSGTNDTLDSNYEKEGIGAPEKNDNSSKYEGTERAMKEKNEESLDNLNSKSKKKDLIKIIYNTIQVSFYQNYENNDKYIYIEMCLFILYHVQIDHLIYNDILSGFVYEHGIRNVVSTNNMYDSFLRSDFLVLIPSIFFNVLILCLSILLPQVFLRFDGLIV